MDKINFDISDVVDQKIIFYKPDGTQIEKQATLEEDANDPDNHYITYANTFPETESILNLVGKYEFAGMVRLANNDSLQSSQRAIFWVQ